MSNGIRPRQRMKAMPQLRNVLFLAIIGLAISISAAAQTPDPFSLTISTPEPEIPAGSVIRLNIRVKNVSEEPIGFVTRGQSRAEQSFTINVLDDAGKPVPKTQYGNSLHPERGRAVGGSLNPGQEGEEFTILSRVFDLSMPGKYLVQVERTDRRRQTTVKSNTITIWVQ